VLHYRSLDTGVTIQSFKALFLWEYAHHLMGELTALTALVPPFIFLYQGRIPSWRRALRCFAVPALVLAQGALGFLLTRDAGFLQGDQSCYRVAAHLGLAVLTYSYVVWCAADILRREPLWLPSRAVPWFRLAASVILLLIMATLISGGLRTGLASHLSAPGTTAPVISLDTYHRAFGALTFLAVLAFWLGGCQRRVCKTVKTPLHGMMAMILLQTLLGLLTTFLPGPVMTVAHQAAAFLLLGFALMTLHGLKDIRRKTAKPLKAG
jgi:cytochrome c oxidase assembly protein subunit 15